MDTDDQRAQHDRDGRERADVRLRHRGLGVHLPQLEHALGPRELRRHDHHGRPDNDAAGNDHGCADNHAADDDDNQTTNDDDADNFNDPTGGRVGTNGERNRIGCGV